MPRLDKTGPRGQGPKTGRQMGNCDGAKGAGIGRGFGRGFCRFFTGRKFFTKKEEKVENKSAKEIKE